MAKLKKLAILCMSVLGTMTLAAGCGMLPGGNTSGSDASESSSVETSTSTESTGGTGSTGSSVAATYTVTVDAPSSVAVDGTLTAEKGKDVTFTATAAKNLVLTVDGAELVGEKAESEDQLSYVYTYKVAAIEEDTTVTITADIVLYAEMMTGSFEFVPNAEATQVTVPLTQGNYYLEITSAIEGEFNVGTSSWYLEPVTYYTISENDLAWTEDGYPLYLQYVEETESTDPVEISYSIYSTMDYNAPMEGAATIIAELNTSLFFDLEETGVYKISTTDPVTFGHYLIGQHSVEPDVTSMIFEVTDVSEPVEITVQKETIDLGVEVEWIVEKVEDKLLVAGDNMIIQSLGNTIKYSFTATEAGAYTVKLTGDNAAYFTLAVCDTMYEFPLNAASAFEFDLEANETASIYVQYNGNANDANGWENDAVLTGSVNVAKTGAVGDRTLDIETYSGTTEMSVIANGTRKVIVSRAPAEVVATWDNTNVTAALEDGTAITSAEAFAFAGAENGDPLVIIFSNATAERQDFSLTVEKYYEPVNLTLETETTISYDPWSDDFVKLVFNVTDFAQNSAPITYFFSIEDTWKIFTDPENPWGSITSFQVTGNGEYVFYAQYAEFAWEDVSTTVKVTATKPVPAADFTATLDTMCSVIVTVAGNNAKDSTVVFTATETGKYILKDLYENGLFAVKTDYYPEQIEAPYSFDLEAGDSIVFYVNYQFTEDDYSSVGEAKFLVNGDYYVNIMICKVVTASVGYNTIPVVVSQGMRGLQINTQPVMFVAPKTGSYMITDSGDSGRAPSVRDVTNAAWVNSFPYTFEAEEGAVVWFDVSGIISNYTEVGDYSVDLVINKVEIATLGEAAAINVGVVTDPRTGFASVDQIYVLCTIAEAGTYTITHDGIVNDETNDQLYVASGYEFTTTEANQTVILVVSIDPMANPNGGTVNLTISAATAA